MDTIGKIIERYNSRSFTRLSPQFRKKSHSNFAEKFQAWKFEKFISQHSSV